MDKALKISITFVVIFLVLLIGCCIAWGFFEQLSSGGFNPEPLLVVCTILTALGLTASIFITVLLFTELYL